MASGGADGAEEEEEAPPVVVPSVSIPPGTALDANERATASSIFDAYQLDNAAVRERRLEPRTIEVMETERVRQALADAGYAVTGNELFALVSAADPAAIGVLTRETFLAVLSRQKMLALEAARTADTFKAYVALGGTVNRTDKVRLQPLLEVVRDFGIPLDLRRGTEGIVQRRMRAFEEVLAMGGELDDDELDDLKATEAVDFDDLEAFVSSARASG